MLVPYGRRALLSVGVLACAAGCFTSDEGLVPPLEAFYYPTGLAVAPDGAALYVANSDFDLQFNGGTVQSINLPVLRDGLIALRDALHDSQGSASACATVNVGANTDRVLNPGPCAPIDVKPFIAQSVTIGAFASAAALVQSPDGANTRMFIPVRGDPSVTFFNLNGVSMDCDATGGDKRCGAAHRIGEDPSDNYRGVTFPVEPVGIAISDDVDGTEAIVVAHQTTNQASLIVNRWDAKGPTLEFTLSQLPEGPTEVASVPTPKYAKLRAGEEEFDYRPSFLLTFRSSPEIDVIRYNSDEASDAPRPFINRVFAEGIAVNSGGQDSRGIAVEPSARRACEADCGEELSCLLDCTKIPIPVFVANRAPASLLIGEVETEITETEIEGETVVTGAFDTVRIYDTVPLLTGASKVAVGHVIDQDGQLSVRVFAVAFDSRFVFVYDPEARRVDTIVRTGRGPHPIAFDTGSTTDDAGNSVPFSFLIVGHFTDSYLGIVDLDVRKQTYGSMFATVGKPTPPAEAN